MNAPRATTPDGHLRTAPGRLVIRDDVGIDDLPSAAWDALAPAQPLLSYAFLQALHGSGCAAPRTGWQPRYLTAWQGEALVGALPRYEKSHSYGEYVFDWAWAQAYDRHGLRYYPKSIAAIPFTPAPGPRLLGDAAATREALLAEALRRLHAPPAHEPAASTLHLLFITADDLQLCERAGMIIRQGIQFHWTNPGYRDFDDYLAAFNHDRRKKIKQERRRLHDAGVEFERKAGADIGPADWALFFRCYENTYRLHRSTPHLTLEFFERLGATMPEHLLLVIGRRDGLPVCAALDVHGAQTLWGRHWGATEATPGLHFEACYYQAIEFCIERGLRRFEGGAQGLHKLARGLLAVPTYSAHAVVQRDFDRAIREHCARERAEVVRQLAELGAAAPFRGVHDEDRAQAGGAQPLRGEGSGVDS